MAFAAFQSLDSTFRDLLNSSRISIVPLIPSKILNFGFHEMYPLLEFIVQNAYLETVSKKEETDVIAEIDRRTAEALHELEDALDSHLTPQILSHYDTSDDDYTLNIAIDLQQLDPDIDLFNAKLIKIKEDFRVQMHELKGHDNDDDNVSTNIDSNRRFKRVTYRVLISLMEKIEQLYYHSAHNSENVVCPKIEIVYKEYLGSLQLLVEKSSNIMSPDLFVDFGREIINSTYDLIIALIIFHELRDLQKLDQDIDSFTSSVIKIKEKYISSTTEPPPSKMVGLDWRIEWLKDEIINYGEDDAHHVLSIYGMVGSGKTTLVRHVYEDPLILSHFQRRAWVKIGPNYRFEKVMSDLLDQLSPCEEDDDELIPPCEEDDDELIPGAWMLQGGESSQLYKILSSKRYLIVFDDLWDTEFMQMFKWFFPEDNNRSRIVITTRIQHSITSNVSVSRGYGYKMLFLNKKESWDLFCEKVFGGKLSCPDELEKVAKKIVGNCEGLPLALIVVGKHLSKSEKTLEYWTNVAKKRIPIFDSADDSYEVIFSSYKYLPSHLKACFLYMGIFPRDSVILAIKFSRLYSGEGLVQPEPNIQSQFITLQYLKALVSNSVIMARGQTSNNIIQTCGVHYVFQHMIQSEASKTKLFHVLNGYDESSLTAETLKGHRRICIHNNVLFGVNKDVHKSMASISTTMRSLLCTGEYHKYPVPIMCSELSLLRVLDALSIRFYQLPFEMLKLVRLRYLALTYNGELPFFISRLCDLQFLIISQHVIVNKSGAPRYLPIEIWNMKELRHLEIEGRELPNPPCTGGSLPNLSTLLDVSFRSCTEEVLKGIPNLKQLAIEIGVDDVNVEPLLLHWCNDLRPLQQLESLKCSIVNPNHTSRVVAPIPSFPVLPSSLKYLILGGFGYPWEHLSQIIDHLSHIQSLYLYDYAFRGPKLELTSKFNNLEFLQIADTDLEYLDGCCASLVYLNFYQCYKLKEIPSFFENLRKLNFYDCNPSAAESAKKTKSAKGEVSLGVKYSFQFDV